MKKRGFTLIELLAVIVVLAIIALIATPIVMNVIKNANKGAAERSAERYMDAVETAIATNRLEHDLIADGTYKIDTDGNLCLEGKTCTEPDLIVEVSGDKPTSGTIVIENGQVVSRGTRMTVGDYTVTIDSAGKAKEVERLVLCRAATPTAQQLYNNSSKAMESAVVGVQATESAPYALGAEYTCDLGDGARTFYVLKTEGDNVKLIMNENLGSTVAWVAKADYIAAGGTESDYGTYGNNNLGPVTAKAALTERTSGWTTLTSAGGTVELPSGQDIADAMGDKSWNDGHGTGTTGPDWMRVNLYNSKSPYRYWTSTAYSDDSSIAWTVDYEGILYRGSVDYSGYTGVRPVITISKDNMSL